jgi:hypothetical protein
VPSSLVLLKDEASIQHKPHPCEVDWVYALQVMEKQKRGARVVAVNHAPSLSDTTSW